MSRIGVTRSFMPPRAEFDKYVDQIFATHTLTNAGPLSTELTQLIQQNMGEGYFLQLVGNGTLALMLALSALDINEGEIITTPFTYVATTSSILWQRCTPVFVDIEPRNFTIDVEKIEAAITPKTKAIMAVHVFGYACDVEKIQEIADRHHLKVIYDGAHAFAAKYKGKSLMSYGDVTTVSFHATKLFHTIEGGGVFLRDEAIAKKLGWQKCFGYDGKEHLMVGINAKMTEFQAAMGLTNFPHLQEIIENYRQIHQLYEELLPGVVQRPSIQTEAVYNYAYFPVLFHDHAEMFRVFAALEAKEIFPRRYFYPSLNQLPYVRSVSCPVSEDITSRIACLPCYVGLTEAEITTIATVIRQTI